jgi:hypothetical protein
MVDFADPKFWTDGAKVMIAAPQIVIPLLTAIAIGVWWFRGSIAIGEIAGLKAEIGAVNARIEALGERLRLAQDSESTIARKSTQLETQVATLITQIAAGASGENLMGATGAISVTASEIKAANTQTGKALGPTGYHP